MNTKDHVNYKIKTDTSTSQYSSEFVSQKWFNPTKSDVTGNF